METIIITAGLSALVSVSVYIIVRQILLKNKKSEIIKSAEVEAENIKKDLQDSSLLGFNRWAFTGGYWRKSKMNME